MVTLAGSFGLLPKRIDITINNENAVSLLRYCILLFVNFLKLTQFGVLVWCDAFVFFEAADEVAAVIVAAGIGHIRNGESVIFQKEASPFYPIMIQIINGCSLQNVPKIAAEILGGQTGNIGQLLQGNRLLVILLDILQCHFDLPQALKCC